MSVDESVNCWQENFCQVLNVQSRYMEDTVSSVQIMAVREELSIPPSQRLQVKFFKSGSHGF